MECHESLSQQFCEDKVRLFYHVLTYLFLCLNAQLYDKNGGVAMHSPLEDFQKVALNRMAYNPICSFLMLEGCDRLDTLIRW